MAMKNSIADFLGKLAIVLLIFGAILLSRLGDTFKEQTNRHIDDGVRLGNLAAAAVGDYFVKLGRYPQSLADLPEKIEPTMMSAIALSSRPGEVVITFRNPNLTAITGRKLYFQPNILNGALIDISCRTDDEEFRKLVGERCIPTGAK